MHTTRAGALEYTQISESERIYGDTRTKTFESQAKETFRYLRCGEKAGQAVAKTVELMPRSRLCHNQLDL